MRYAIIALCLLACTASGQTISDSALTPSDKIIVGTWDDGVSLGGDGHDPRYWEWIDCVRGGIQYHPDETYDSIPCPKYGGWWVRIPGRWTVDTVTVVDTVWGKPTDTAFGRYVENCNNRVIGWIRRYQEAELRERDSLVYRTMMPCVMQIDTICDTVEVWREILVPTVTRIHPESVQVEQEWGIAAEPYRDRLVEYLPSTPHDTILVRVGDIRCRPDTTWVVKE